MEKTAKKKNKNCRDEDKKFGVKPTGKHTT